MLGAVRVVVAERCSWVPDRLLSCFIPWFGWSETSHGFLRKVWKVAFLRPSYLKSLPSHLTHHWWLAERAYIHNCESSPPLPGRPWLCGLLTSTLKRRGKPKASLISLFCGQPVFFFLSPGKLLDLLFILGVVKLLSHGCRCGSFFSSFSWILEVFQSRDACPLAHKILSSHLCDDVIFSLLSVGWMSKRLVSFSRSHLFLTFTSF